jgi:N-acetyl-gamma-glutamyl-phosphate reductase
VQVTFVPHLAPYKRGLLSSIYVFSDADSPSIEELFDLYVRRYSDEPFVSVCPPPSMPDVATVACTNQARIGLAKDERTGVITVSTAIDNLGKGAASQAVQCANIMFGFDETAGLVSIQGVV